MCSICLEATQVERKCINRWDSWVKQVKFYSTKMGITARLRWCGQESGAAQSHNHKAVGSGHVINHPKKEGKKEREVSDDASLWAIEYTRCISWIEDKHKTRLERKQD